MFALQSVTLVTGISVRPQTMPAWPRLPTVAVMLLMRMLRQIGVVLVTAAIACDAAVEGLTPMGSLYVL